MKIGRNIARTRRRAWRACGHVLLAAASLGAVAQPALPVGSPAAEVVSPALERKIREARSQLKWLVDEGESLYGISRHLARDEAQAARLAREIEGANPAAFVAGDPARLIVGALLQLPASVADDPGPGVALAVAPSKRASAPSARPAPYVDRLIEGLPGEEEETARSRERDDSPGLRASSVEYRADHRDQSQRGRDTSQGLALRHRAETERHGDFLFEGEAARESGVTRPGGPRHLGRATLYHDQFALTNGVVLNSTLGALRLGLSPWLASSFRVQLPSSIAVGATTVMDAGRWRFSAGAGELGRLAGIAVQGFRRTEGEAAFVEASTRISSGVQAGGAVMRVSGTSAVPEHVGATLATEVELPGIESRVKLQAAGNDRGTQGFWIDGHRASGRWNQQFGAFHFDPGFVFGESAALSDTRGTYWRGDYRDPRYTSSFSVDALQTNLDRDPARGGSTGVGALGHLNLKLDRSTMVGAGLSLREERPRTGERRPRHVQLATGFLSRQTPWGLARLDLSLNRNDLPGEPAEWVRSVAWAHYWPRLGSVEVNTLLSIAQERRSGRDLRRTTVSAGLRGGAFGPVNWDAAVSFVRLDDGENSERNYNATLGLDWSPAPEWVLRLQWLRNQIEPASPNPLVPFVRENAVQLSARYEDIRGRPYPRVAAAGGRSGTGWIEGHVFFDENGDGERQATERGAPGVLVILNGRSTQLTDRDGRFEFGLVASGEHALSIAVDRVPLPWGLADERPRRTTVRVREGTRTDIPLARITP